MIRYQHADVAAAAALIHVLSPPLFRFFCTAMGSRSDAEDMLQDAWLRIHRVRHTYRAGEPLLPWVYAIARRVRVDHFRKRHRIASHETHVDALPHHASRQQTANNLPSFDELVAPLPESQREILTMLKVNGLSIEEVARAQACSAGAVKQKAHRAYERLRNMLQQSPALLARKGAST